MIRPVVALTLGDPAGIGPEIVLKAIRKRALTEKVNLVIIGDLFVLRGIASRLHINCLLPRFSTLDGPIPSRNFPCLLDRQHMEFSIPMGCVDARCGALSLDYLETAIRLAANRVVDGIVTGPIHKQAWAAAGSKFTGHTEMLAARTHSRSFAMAFYAKKFLTVLLTTHLPLKDAISALTPRLVEEKILLTIRALREIGSPRARVAVAGVNPHAGEGGLLGDEERRIFLPVIRKCRKMGLEVSGPYPADTLYIRAARGEFDAVLAPYHDQAMLAIKTLSFGHATNITLGLPFVRTSVDHGTAFDITGRGLADETALVEAIYKCRDLILARREPSSKIRRSSSC